MSKKRIDVGGVPAGGGAPVSVQSMTNTDTEDAGATIHQILRLEAAGCDIVRVAVPTAKAARSIADIKKEIGIPLVADIHFDYRLAIEAARAGADKIRINPGNIGGEDRVRAVADTCRGLGIPIRIGINGGSLEKDILNEYGYTAEALVASALRQAELLNRFDFDDICISVKSSDVPLTIAAYRLLAERTEYPLHLGVTEAGTEYSGLVRSSVGIGALLADGIGDTLRVSLTADPEREVVAGIEILKALELRSGGVRVVSCPSCGRCKIDLIHIAEEVEGRLKGMERDMTVAVMGCVVNGPGEARRADYGVAGGDGEGLIFRRGEVILKAGMAEIVDKLIELIERDG
jgi:(E)-4-hydroxy-3-methylbut-2-enyl-diphosphate synthase